MATKTRIVGVGIDVVAINRLARLRAWRPSILELVCAPEEKAISGTDERAAQLWAGKEAIAKSLGTGLWQSGVDWKQIRILENHAVQLSGAAARVAGESRVSVTFSALESSVLAVAIRSLEMNADRRGPVGPER